MSNTTYKICPQCGAQMERRENVMTTSHPAQYIYDCPRCGSIEYDSILYPCDLGELATQSKNEVDLCDKTDRYEEALEKARVIYKGRKAMHYTDEVSDLEFLFPELAETYDEMMIEAIIDALNSHCNSINHLSARGYQMEDVKAWLEKRKISTEGDFGCGYDSGYQAGYAVAMNEKKPKAASATLDSEKQKPTEKSDFKVRLADYMQKASQKDGRYVLSSESILEMAEEELIKRGVVQKPTEWSEEDRRAIDRACVALRAYANGELPDILPSQLLAYADRLQSLRPQPKPTDLPAGFYYIDQDGNKYYSKEFRYGDMKVQVGERKPAEGKYYSPDSGTTAGCTAEWNEEDEKMCQSILNLISITFSKTYRKEINWLKSLKNRGNSPKSNANSPCWKPSEEQIEAFENCLESIPNKYFDDMCELYADLKKKMEE